MEGLMMEMLQFEEDEVSQEMKWMGVCTYLGLCILIGDSEHW